MTFKTPATAMRERFASVKARGFRRSLREDGAIDLASIMVGVLVMGILGAVIAAAVFAVIPWSQNEAAKGNLDAVKTAQSVQFTMSSGNGSAAYATDEILEGTTNASNKSLLQDNASVDIVIATNGTGYVAVSKSATGAKFYITSLDPSKVLTAAPTVVTGELTGVSLPTTTPWN